MKSDFEKTVSLDGNWELFYAENKNLAPGEEYKTICALNCSTLPHVCARVPGNFELDLMRTGLIEDIFYGENPLLAQKRENLHLWYARTFEITETVPQNLIFEGVDTFADIYLNGVLIGSTDNMLIAHTISAENLICGKNELVVHIKPVFLESRKHPIGAGVIVHQKYNAESLCIRKAAHMFGWDIMPRILSGGIWKSVRLEQVRKERLEEIYLRTAAIRPSKAILRLYYQAAVTGDLVHEYQLRIEGVCKDSRFEENFRLWNTSATEHFDVEAPYLWWVRDMGEQNLYEITATLSHFDQIVDRVSFRMGICKFDLKRTSLADDGGEFCFYLNKEPLFVRGTNWVPLDALHSRDTERLPHALDLLKDSGCNMVRFWGGNVYEDEKMFEYCDENGIAVWQDFAMGCASYPMNEYLCKNLETEVTAVVKKYRQHPCIALWAGDNECDEAAALWKAGGVDPNRNILTRKIIPSVLTQHDPERYYLPSSPYIDEHAYASGIPGNTPEKHLWGPRDYFKSEFYTSSAAVFASETGYHGCPAPESIEKFISPSRLWHWENNPEWQIHATCMETGPQAKYAFRIPLMANQIRVLFCEEPQNLEQFAKMSQASQAEAMKFFIERFRSGKWKRTGIIWWNLIDGWPQFSDAVVDYYYAKKLAYYIIRRSQQPICLMFREPYGGKSELVGANEYLKEVSVFYRVTDMTEDITLLEGTALLGKNQTTPIAQTEYHSDEMHFYLIEWSHEGKRGKNYYVSGNAPYSFEAYERYMKKSGMWEADGFH
ncbi:MAG: hypothetical protein IJA86_04315 [Clostridia bacterium]|nr:hypothetical protein [Clostridia bacterium]